MSKVTVYSKPNCMLCGYAKRYLNDNNILYDEINVLEDDDVLAEIRDAGYTQMPVVDIDGIKHSGFRPDILAKAGVTLW